MKDMRRKDLDDDVGTNGDDTTDDEGGVDTPPPTSKADDEEDQENDISNGNADDEEKSTSKIDSGEYEVDQIVDMNVVRGGRKCPVNFRVRWVGFGEKEDTWLPASQLSCQESIDDFLEISGRKPEYLKAMKRVKKEPPPPAVPMRASSRIIAHKFHYGELDEDDDEILPSGTRTRKLKTMAECKQMTMAERKQMPPPSKKMKRGASEQPEEAEYEVEKLIDRRLRGRVIDYKVRWKGFTSKHDSWIPATDLNCPKMVEVYNNKRKGKSEEETFEVESIISMRESKGFVEYKVHWKNWSTKYDSWLPEDEMHCPDILKKFKQSPHVEKRGRKKAVKKTNKGRKKHKVEEEEKEEEEEQAEEEEEQAEEEGQAEEEEQAEEEDVEVEVQEILDSRERRGKTEYLVRWKGYGQSSDTWEPSANLEGCPKIVQTFLNKQQKETAPPKAAPTSASRKGRKSRNSDAISAVVETPPTKSPRRRSAARSYSEFYNQ